MDTSKGKYWDEPWGLVQGCTKWSPACLNCWSEAMAIRYKQTGFDWKGNIKIRKDKLSLPIRSKKVYAIWTDLFHEKVDDDFILGVFCEMAFVKNSKFLVCTKRIERAKEYIEGIDLPDNAYLGTTICDQEEADKNIPILLQIPAKHRWLSIEPILSPIDLHLPIKPIYGNKIVYYRDGEFSKPQNFISQVIVGCESGIKRRPCDIGWIQDIIVQCESAGVPVFVKQMNLGGKCEHDINKFPKSCQRGDLIWQR